MALVVRRVGRSSGCTWDAKADWTGVRDRRVRTSATGFCSACSGPSSRSSARAPLRASSPPRSSAEWGSVTWHGGRHRDSARTISFANSGSFWSRGLVVLRPVDGMAHGGRGEIGKGRPDSVSCARRSRGVSARGSYHHVPVSWSIGKTRLLLFGPGIILRGC